MKKAIYLILVLSPFFVSAQKGCDFFSHKTIQIEKTNINSAGSDMGPAFVNDELWYSSFTEDEIKELSKGKTKGIFYHLNTVATDTNGNIAGTAKPELTKSSEGLHAGPVSYCKATGELFVTLSNGEEPDVKNVIFKKAKIRLKIVIAKMIDGAWVITENFPFNNSKYSVGHPAISTTADTLFFTSNMPSTLGGTDIYMSVRENGKWTEPQNLGSKINTPADEMFPFLSSEGFLFFASNGRKTGATDLDLYYSCISEDTFSEPAPATELNSEFDDFGLVIHKNGEVGYFNSQRKGGEGDDDIYKVILEQKEYKLELLVRDKETQLPIPFASVTFNDGVKLTTDENGIVKRDLDNKTDYTASSGVKGYMDGSISFSTSGANYGVLKQVIDLEKLEVGKTFTIENIYYDFDKWNLLPESKIILDKLVRIMKENPGLKAELGSHTDSRGSDAYNMKLSQKRSESAVSYIISSGISEDRIIAKGYGETQLINQCSNGVSCTEEQHRMNRRTEFKILELTK